MSKRARRSRLFNTRHSDQKSATTEVSRNGTVVFRAKAVVLATGGIGKAYKITSNSWEYTGDGHSLAYHAGAELIDMEFIQFHPTGMVWPPSVRGILVTESVRGEGGVLRNSKGDRFMFGDIPDNYKPQTADNEEEGFLYVLGGQKIPHPDGPRDARVQQDEGALAAGDVDRLPVAIEDEDRSLREHG